MFTGLGEVSRACKEVQDVLFKEIIKLCSISSCRSCKKKNTEEEVMIMVSVVPSDPSLIPPTDFRLIVISYKNVWGLLKTPEYIFNIYGVLHN